MTGPKNQGGGLGLFELAYPSSSLPPIIGGSNLQGRTRMTILIPTIVDLIRSARIDLSNEKRAQADVELLLTQAGVVFEREVRLTDEDIVDFLIEGIGLELKLRGARKKEVYRQLCRYARHERIEALVLASNLSMGLPGVIEGKDAYFVKLGEGWL